MNRSTPEGKENPVVTLRAQAEEFDFSKLRADENNKLANSGEQMYKDFQRMDFIINEKKIDKNFIIALKEGARHQKSELFNSDAIHNTFNEKKSREIDTDFGQAFVASVLKDLEKELAKDALGELWKEHCANPETTDEQKTDSYKKEFERFYNIGQKYIHLAPEADDENKNYRPFAKAIFVELFKHVGAEVPSDAILEELITNCNQAGYESASLIQAQVALGQHSFIVGSPERVMNIDCVEKNNVRIRSDMELPIFFLKIDGTRGNKVCDLSNSLEFILEYGKDGVTYKDGKLLLTVPKELKNYKIGDKNLFDIIKEYFQKFCEKLGFKFETKVQIQHDLGPSLKVNSHLESILPTHVSTPIRAH